MDQTPYAPPEAPIDPASGESLEDGVHRQRARARWVMGLLAVGILCDAAAVLSGLMQHSLLTRAASGASIEEAEASANDLRHGTIGILQGVTFLATAVVWLFWMYRAYANLKLMGTKQANYTPGWAVGYWFFPVLNLFRPYQITKELWRRSRDRNAPEATQMGGTPALLGLWWLTWIVSSTLGRIVARASMNPDGLEELLSVTRWEMVDSALGILSALLALAVVRGIDRLQAAAVPGSFPAVLETPA